MKKITIFLFVILAVLSGCKKDETNKPATVQTQTPTPKEEVKIFLSGAGVKSGPIEVMDGDTVDAPWNKNVLMYATSYNGPVAGYWRMYQKISDNPFGWFSAYHLNGDYGDQISYKFGDHGLYQVAFGKFIDYQVFDTLKTFYVRVQGTPGKVSDDQKIFCLEIKELCGNSGEHKFLFAWFKYQTPIAENQAYVSLIYFVGENAIDTLYAKKIAKWPFSTTTENYYYFILDLAEIPDNVLFCSATFLISNDGGWSGMVDPNNFVSSWTNGKNGIEFSIQQ